MRQTIIWSPMLTSLVCRWVTCLTTIEQLTLPSAIWQSQPNRTAHSVLGGRCSSSLWEPLFGRRTRIWVRSPLKKTEWELGPQNPTTTKKEGAEAYSTRRCLSDWGKKVWLCRRLSFRYVALQKGAYFSLPYCIYIAIAFGIVWLPMEPVPKCVCPALMSANCMISVMVFTIALCKFTSLQVGTAECHFLFPARNVGHLVPEYCSWTEWLIGTP